MTTALSIEGLVAGRGGIPAVRDFSMQVKEGEIVALLGPNGAGKSTTLWTVSGALAPLAGRIEFYDRDIAGRPAHWIARKGLRLVPDDRGIFHQLTVQENFRLHERKASRDLRDRSQADVLQHFPALGALMRRPTGLLSGGEQQMLALGCALLAAPRLLLIDEMSTGLAPVVVQRLLPLLRQIATSAGVAIVLVEQHVGAALDIADRAYVLNHGELVLSGDAADLRSSKDLLEASYFGWNASSAPHTTARNPRRNDSAETADSQVGPS
jgi:branched-chain amino acid transport system ATP-binding protein